MDDEAEARRSVNRRGYSSHQACTPKKGDSILLSLAITVKRTSGGLKGAQQTRHQHRALIAFPRHIPGLTLPAPTSPTSRAATAICSA